ncbi:MAG: trimethylamine methyltransferase family protein, partial [Eubacterium sp.]
IVLCALANPKAPLFYGTLGTVGNMRNGSAPVGVPEEAILEAAGAQLARYYGIPSRGNCGWTSALECDYQAGAETALRVYNTLRCGINVLFGLGDLTSLSQGSKEKFILDVETVENARRIMRPLNFTPEKMCVDLMDKVSHSHSYLEEKHTLKHFRQEFHQPQLFNRITYEAWERDERIHLNAKAHQKVCQILKDFQMPDRDPSIKHDLDRLFKAQNIL